MSEPGSIFDIEDVLSGSAFRVMALGTTKSYNAEMATNLCD
jgi:hypothetical protein